MSVQTLRRAVCLLSLSLLTSVLAAAGSDHAREKLIGDRLQRDLSYGDVVWLLSDEDGGTFPALMTWPEDRNGGYDAVILVHGMGGHPDWPDVISPLREWLYKNGYPSLSLQMPILAPGTPYAKYGETVGAAMTRIVQGIRFLKENGYSDIYLIGYGFGAATAADYLATHEPASIRAFVAISILSQKYLKPRPDITRYLQAINIPVLDIYGEQDLESVRKGAPDRKQAVNKNNKARYTQIEVSGAGHSYTDSVDELTSPIADWLKSVEFAAGLDQSGAIKQTTD